MESGDQEEYTLGRTKAQKQSLRCTFQRVTCVTLSDLFKMSWTYNQETVYIFKLL